MSRSSPRTELTAPGDRARSRRSPARLARVLGLGFALHMKMMTRSSFDGFLNLLWPLFFSTVAFFMFEAGAGGEALVFAAFGAAVMGIWSSTSTSAASTMQRERWHGTLELLVCAPVHFAAVLLPVTIAMAAMGLYSMVATLLMSRFVFGIDLPFEQPVSLGVALVVTVGSIGALGFLLAVSFVRYRTAWALGNMFEYPVWLIAGFLVPVTLLPDWVRPISWALAPTWGVDAIREAGAGAAPWPEIGAAAGLGALYLTVAIAVLDGVLRSARQAGSLSLS
jgi:ABC-2 type transport system permease protein